MDTKMGYFIGLLLFFSETLFSQSFIESHRQIELKNMNESVKQLKLIKSLKKDSLIMLKQAALNELNTKISILKDAFLQYSHYNSFNFDTASTLKVFLCYGANRDLKIVLSISGKDTLLYKTKKMISKGFFTSQEFNHGYDAKLEALLTYSLTQSRLDLINILKNNRTFDELQLVTLSGTKIESGYEIELHALNPFVHRNFSK